MLFALLMALHFCAAAALLAGMDRLALAPWRRAQAAHWTERARLLWPVRRVNALLLFTIPGGLCAMQASLFPRLPLADLYAALAGIAGATLGLWPTAKAMIPEMPFTGWLRDVVAAFVIRIITFGVLIAAGILMPYHLDWTAIALTAAVVAFTTWLIRGGMIWLLRVTGVLVAPPARLANLVSDVAAQMELPLPRVWLLRGYGANAVAFPAIHTLVVTEKALDALPDDELGAVCAHEFAHLNEPGSVILGRIVSAFVLLPAIYFKPAIEAWQMMGYFGVCAALIIASKLTRAFRRRMETRADAVATSHEGPAPGAYARALEHLYEINQVPAVLRGSLTHPNLYDRMLAAGVTPAYPRPIPPARFTWLHGGAILLLAVSAFGVGIRIGTEDRDRRNTIQAPGQK